MARRRPTTSQTRSRRGFITVDVVLGLAIVAMLAGALAVALNRRHHAAERLADTRTATALAERALAQLQAGKPSSADGASVEPLAVEGSSPPAGYTWVRVRGEHNGRTAVLTGLVPASAAPKGGKP